MREKIHNILNEVEAKEVIETILPDLTIRDIALSLLVEGIGEASLHNRRNWALTNTDPGTVWFQVGHYAALTLQNNQIWLALDKYQVEHPSGNGISFMEENEYGWRPDMDGLLHFKDRHKPGIDFSTNGYYLPPSYESHLAVWPHLRRMFFEFIYQAQYNGQAMLATTKKVHVPALLMHLRSETGRNLPDPLFF